MVLFSVFFFFFKQKTAYEMRISDWSSDVCSSDLIFLERKGPRVAEPAREHGRRRLMPRRGEQIGGRAGAAVEEFIAAADREIGVGAVEGIGRASCRERGCQYV